MFIRKHFFSWRHLEINSFNHALSALIMCIFSVRQSLHRLEILLKSVTWVLGDMECSTRFKVDRLQIIVVAKNITVL